MQDTSGSKFDPANNPWQAAILRGAFLIIALAVGATVFLLLPDSSIRSAAAGLIIAAIMGMEEFIKVKAS